MKSIYYTRYFIISNNMTKKYQHCANTFRYIYPFRSNFHYFLFES